MKLKISFTRTLRTLFLIAVSAAIVAGSVSAAELRLRSQCSPRGAIVTLGDVAEIIAADSQKAATLSAIELFPSPAGAEQRFVRVREIQDLLLLRGVNLTEHQFSGSSEVIVQAVAAQSRSQVERPVSAVMGQRVKQRVIESLTKYLCDRASQNAWLIDCDLSDAQIRQLSEQIRKIVVSGGCSPWIGTQQFDLAIDGPQGKSSVAVQAHVRIAAPVVVPIRALARGAVIREGDVELQSIASSDSNPSVLRKLEDVIGHEIVRAIPAGKPISTDALRSPLVVHRGEVVTVYSHSSGIRIRTIARAREEGSLGDLVAVESPLDHETYYARVSGVREVEVYARPPQAEREAATPVASNSVFSR